MAGFAVTTNSSPARSHRASAHPLVGRVIWARQAGAQFSEPIAGHGIAVDRGGNSYVIGYYRGNITFGDYVLKSLGETDIFVAKITAQFSPRR